MSGKANSSVVLDSWAMMAYLDGEPAAQEVRQMLRKARKQQLVVSFCLVNYGECLYIIEKERGLQDAQRAVGIIDQLALEIIPADRPLVFEAARFKARYPISYADAFCAALAKMNHSTIVTGDPEFRSILPEVSVHWLPDLRTPARH